MAHYVAELIDRSRTAVGKKKAESDRECRSAIVDIWAHRRSTPDQRLVEDLEPVIETIDLLRQDGDPFYHRRIWASRRREASENEESIREWLKLALEADIAARSLIGWALGKAAASSIDQALPWIELARGAGISDDRLVALTIRLQGLNPTLKDADLERDAIRQRLTQLRDLRQIVATAEMDLRADLAKLREKRPKTGSAKRQPNNRRKV